jgi:hypothetical protein
MPIPGPDLSDFEAEPGSAAAQGSTSGTAPSAAAGGGFCRLKQIRKAAGKPRRRHSAEEDVTCQVGCQEQLAGREAD